MEYLKLHVPPAHILGLLIALCSKKWKEYEYWNRRWSLIGQLQLPIVEISKYLEIMLLALFDQ